MGKQKNSAKQMCYDPKHKTANPKAYSSKTIKDGDAKKKSSGKTVKNIY